MIFASRYLLGFFLFITVCTTSYAYSQSPDIPNVAIEEVVPIRSQALNCVSFFSSPVVEQIVSAKSDKPIPVSDHISNQSVGVQIPSNDPVAIRKQIKSWIADQGSGVVKNSIIYVAGVPLDQKLAVRDQYQKIISEEGWDQLGLKLKILAVPRHLLEKRVAKGVTEIIERLRYSFFPDLEANYQKPLMAEVVANIRNTVYLEAPTVGGLLATLPSPDVQITIATHATTLLIYNVFTKFTTNWILKPGSDFNLKTRFQNINKFLEVTGMNMPMMFAKSGLMTLPFVLNFNIGAHFTEIQKYWSEFGMGAVLSAVPEHLLQFFGSSNSLTLWLQTVFYAAVQNGAIGAWENRQGNLVDSERARLFTKDFSILTLSLDALFLSLASTHALVLAQVGPFDFNIGHVGLASLILLGQPLRWESPQLKVPDLAIFGKNRGTTTQLWDGYLLDKAYDWWKPMDTKKTELLGRLRQQRNDVALRFQQQKAQFFSRIRNLVQ